MPITTIGFDGTIDDSALSRLLTLAVGASSVGSRADLAVTAVSGTRAVRIAAGSGYAPGLAVISTDTPTINLPAPSAGQWHMIVCRRNWDVNTVEFLALPHITTTTTSPISPPAGLPALFKNQPGIVTDQKLAWAWVVTGATAVQIVDLRELPPGLPRRGTTAERTTYYGAIPTFVAARRALQGSRWFNTDTNLEEVYMADYDSVENPGGVGDSAPAGWFGVGNNGDPVIASSSFPAYLDTPPAKVSLVDYVDVKLTQGRFVEVEHYMSWYSPGNAAGTLNAYLDSSRVPLKSQHIHSNGGAIKYGPVWLRYKLWMPAGTHRLNVEFSVESASAANGKIRTASTVTGAR